MTKARPRKLNCFTAVNKETGVTELRQLSSEIALMKQHEGYQIFQAGQSASGDVTYVPVWLEPTNIITTELTKSERLELWKGQNLKVG